MLTRLVQIFRHHKILFWSDAALLFVGLACLVLPSYGSYCESDYANNYYCAAYGVAVTGGGFVEAHGGAITALATVAIGWFTWTLWRTNKRELAQLTRSVDTTDATSKSELRAYLGINGGRFYLRADHIFCRLNVHNSGQTPAQGVTHCINGEIITAGDLPYFDMLDPLPRKWDMVPNADLTMEKKVALPASVGSYDNFRFGEGALEIFVWGAVHYTDIFGEPQCVQFRYSIEGRPTQIADQPATRGWDPIPCEHGNRIT